jgi:hypothetical protein
MTLVLGRELDHPAALETVDPQLFNSLMYVVRMLDTLKQVVLQLCNLLTRVVRMLDTLAGCQILPVAKRIRLEQARLQQSLAVAREFSGCKREFGGSKREGLAEAAESIAADREFSGSKREFSGSKRKSIAVL